MVGQGHVAPSGWRTVEWTQEGPILGARALLCPWASHSPSWSPSPHPSGEVRDSQGIFLPNRSGILSPLFKLCVCWGEGELL